MTVSSGMRDPTPLTTHSEIFKPFQLLPGLPDSLEEQLKAQDEDECPHHHDWNIADDDWTNNQDYGSERSKHESSQPRVSS
jgi:hypothetical protein